MSLRFRPLSLVPHLLCLWALILWGCDSSGGPSHGGGGPVAGGASVDATPNPDGGQGVPDDALYPPPIPTPDAGRSPDGAPPGDAAPPPDAASSGNCPVAFQYDPLAGQRLETFPDDYYTRPDARSPTGLRVDLSAQRAPWVSSTVGNYASVFDQLSTLDGWGTTAGIILRFSGPVALPPEGGRPAIRLVQLAPAAGGLNGATGAAVDIPFEVQTTDDGATLILWPMVPLAPATRHGVIVTTALTAADGDCVGGADVLHRVMTQPADTLPPELAPLAARYAALLTQTDSAADDVVGATVFTTQSIVEDSVAVAADITRREFTWSTPPVCSPAAPGDLFRVCDGAFVAGNYLGPDGRVAGDTPQMPYTLPVRIWLPNDAPRPYPVVIFGHGLGSDRSQAGALAEFAAPMGIATVAIDAPSHGDHPTAVAATDLLRIGAFFGIDFQAQTLDALVLRDHWREATYDKLQLIRLLTQQPFVDSGNPAGDGSPDLDTRHLAYLGVSLGGIMGSELLALSPDVGLGVLSVPGGRVASIISDAPMFALLVRAMTPPHTPPGEVARFFPVLQTAIERGDSANYAPYVLKNRLPGAGERAPNLLFDMAIDDQIVPNVCNRALARALGVPQVAPALQTVGVIPEAPAAPFSGNLNEGRTTAGLFQFDRVTEHAGEAPVKAAHDNLAKSVEGILQATHFLETWISGGPPELVDPYVVLGTPPLAE